MNTEKEMRKQLYITLGLSQKEAEIYELLLSRGEMAARDVELTTGFKKNTYVLVKELEKKKLIIKIERGRRIFYQPAPPENLKILAKAQLKAAQANAGTLLELLPSMQTLYRESVDRPVVRYVEGEEGLRALYKEVYGQDISASYGCLDLSAVEKAVPQYMTRELIPERVTRNSRAYAVLTDNTKGQEVHERDEEENRESIMVDATKYPLPAEVSVYGDKVVLLSFKKGGVTGIMVENKEIATSLTSIYRLLFDHRTK